MLCLLDRDVDTLIAAIEAIIGMVIVVVTTARMISTRATIALAGALDSSLRQQQQQQSLKMKKDDKNKHRLALFSIYLLWCVLNGDLCLHLVCKRDLGVS